MATEAVAAGPMEPTMAVSARFAMQIRNCSRIAGQESCMMIFGMLFPAKSGLMLSIWDVICKTSLIKLLSLLSLLISITFSGGDVQSFTDI